MKGLKIMLNRIIAAFAALALSASLAVAQTNCRVSTSAPTYVDGTSAPLSCDTSGGVRTSSGGGGGGTVTQGPANDGSTPWYVRFATAQAVSQSGTWNVANTGTFAVQAAQSGTWTVQPGNTANTTPWLFTISQGGNSAVVSSAGALAANLAQIAGNTILAGNGATGTGSARVTIANDTSAIAGWGLGATGSAAPSGAQQTGVRSGANMVAMTQANASAAISVSTATTTQLVALSASAVIHVTSFDVIAAGTGNIKFVYGTGSSCGTGTTDLTGNYNLTAQAGIAKGSGIGPVLVVPAGNALCVTTSAAVGMYGSVSYTQFVP